MRIKGNAQYLSGDLDERLTCVVEEKVIVGEVADGIVGKDDIDQRGEQRQCLSIEERFEVREGEGVFLPVESRCEVR